MSGKTAEDYEGKYTEPQLRVRLKEEIKASDKGGKPGQWSARKSQMLVQRYEAEGGGYKDDEEQRDAAASLERWTDENWQTKGGSGYADEGGKPMKRYLPERAWDLLSDEEKKRTDRKKREEGDEAGKQFVENTVEAKAARAYVTHGDASELSVSQLERLTRDELYNLAKGAELKGRGKLDHDELAQGLHEYYQDQTGGEGSGGDASGSGGTEEMTKAELYEEAKELDVEGRSTMDKSELKDAVEDERG